MVTVLLRSVSKLHTKNNLWLLTRHISFYPRNQTFTTPSTCSTVKRLSSSNNPKNGTEVDKNQPAKPSNEPPATLQHKLKKAVAEYGSTVIIFHVGISLVSLGTFYLLVSSGLDVSRLIETLGISSESVHKVATNAGTFAVAYTIHKVFAPVRIGITLTATPFIVRYLRRIGVLHVK